MYSCRASGRVGWEAGLARPGVCRPPGFVPIRYIVNLLAISSVEQQLLQLLLATHHHLRVVWRQRGSVRPDTLFHRLHPAGVVVNEGNPGNPPEFSECVNDLLYPSAAWPLHIENRHTKSCNLTTQQWTKQDWKGNPLSGSINEYHQPRKEELT